MKTNKELLKELALEIRKFKQSRKQDSPDHGKYEDWKIPSMSYDARCRSIFQALKNRKISKTEIEEKIDVQDFLSELGIELKVKDCTNRIYAFSLTRLYEAEENAE